MKAVILFSLTLFTQWAWALELRFGPEFAFSNQELLNCQKPMPNSTPDIAVYRADFCDNPKIKEKYAELYELWQSKYVAWAEPGNEFLIERQNLNDEDRALFIAPEEYGVWLGVDPSVIELGTTPMTIQEFKQHKQQLQQMIFDDNREIGLVPQMFTGGGHINIGLQEFKENRLLLMNFLIDFYNHPELALGVFGYDTNNALSLRQSNYNIHQLAVELQELNGNKGRRDGQKFRNFLEHIDAAIAPYASDKFLEYWNKLPAGHQTLRKGNYAIHLNNGNNTGSDYRIEIRSVRPQISIDQWIRMIELLQARINYLKQFDELIPIEANPLQIKKEGPIDGLLWDPPVDPQEALKKFYQYVTESGLNWLDHQDYLWPKWHAEGEVIKFNNHMMETCENFLK